MLRLRPYKMTDAAAITSWIKNEYIFRQWCADRYDRYPLTPADMNAYYNQMETNDTIWGMTAFDETGVVGHFTMRFPSDDKKEIRLGFVIVDDSKRGQGYGKDMLKLAIHYAFDCIKVDTISLGVFENNVPARKCYESVGFRPVIKDIPEQYWCLGEVWTCIEMQLDRLWFQSAKICDNVYEEVNKKDGISYG